MTRRQRIAKALANAQRHLDFTSYAHMVNGDVKSAFAELEASVARARVIIDRIPDLEVQPVPDPSDTELDEEWRGL